MSLPTGSSLDSLDRWAAILGLQPESPAVLVAGCALAAILIVLVVPVTAVFSYLERKIGADLQARVGPSRAGPAGLLQPVLDFLKLIQKRPAREGGRAPFGLTGRGGWFWFYFLALFATLAAFPVGSKTGLVQSDATALLPFWVAMMAALVFTIAGQGRGDLMGKLGANRVAAQVFSGSFPAVLGLTCAGISAGSFRWEDIARVQGAYPHQWLALGNPFQFLALFVFVASGMVLFGFPPLEGGYEERDIPGGNAVSLEGIRLIVFRFGRKYALLFWSAMATMLFLGGWRLPEPVVERLEADGFARVLLFAETGVVVTKAMALMVLLGWVARVNPKARISQVTAFSWFVLAPLGVACVLGNSIWVAVWRIL